jgi:hypothetical protein
MTVLNAEPRVGLSRLKAVPAPAAVSSWTEWGLFAVVAAQLGLLVWIIRLFELESARFGDLAVLALVGFVIHHLLPLRLRLPFFVVLSLGGLYLIAHGKIALWVTGAGLVLIGICHLPIRFVLRVGLLLVAGGFLACFRGGWLAMPVNSAAWMILASMFMFRLMIYLYDLYRQSAPFSPFRAMAYFFMIPNVCFPTFPVVDYKTFCSTYFNDRPLRIYQTGLRWILRGVVHLLLYRVVYQLILLDPHEVTDLAGVARYSLSIVLQYLKISGQFHIIVGLLHLFGFNLPETNHLYYLASNFTDLWRRINIYWKDFVMKLFFYPTFFRVKGLGQSLAIALATLAAFLATWVLHAYQGFWLRGTWPITWQDAFFWGALAILVLINALSEAKQSRKRTLSKPRRTFWSELSRAGKTIGTFVTMCFLWTVWSCRSTEELWALALAAKNVTLAGVLSIVAGLTVLGLAAVLWGHSRAERTAGGSVTPAAGPAFSWRGAALGFASCALILVLSLTPIRSQFEGTPAGDVLAALRYDQANEMDEDSQRRGYYEDLDVTRNQEDFGFLRTGFQWGEGGLKDPPGDSTTDFMLLQGAANYSREVDHKRITTNHWGMRDREYDQAKPPAVYRIALFGSSHERGSGVGDEETFKYLLEEQLNRANTNPAIRKYEILNFSVASYGAFQKLLQMENLGFSFSPDAVFFVTYAPEGERTLDHLAKVIRLRPAIPEAVRAPISRAIEAAGVNATMSEERIRRLLKPYIPELLSFAFQRLADRCHERGVPVYVVYRPQPQETSRTRTRRQQLLELAQAADLPILDLSPAFKDVSDRRTLMLDPTASYSHTNELGHRLLADELYKQLHDPNGALILKPRQ